MHLPRVLEVPPSIPTKGLRFVACICNLQVAFHGYCLVNDVDNGQSIGSIVSDATIRTWLRATANNMSRLLGSFSSIIDGI